MHSLHEHGDRPVAQTLAARIRAVATRRWVVMETGGGQTHALVAQGLAELVTPAIGLVRGPACPVCVVPPEQIEQALRLAVMPKVLFVAAGDLLGPGGGGCNRHPPLGQARTVSSPLDAVDLAVRHPDQEVVFFAVGFEATAPAHAMAVWRAHQLGVRNFSMLVRHVTVPAAMLAVLDTPGHGTQAFLAAGHVCSVTRWTDYEPIAAKYRVPIVVTGFEPVDLLEGMYLAIRQLEEGRYEVENQYVRSVRREGAPPARQLVAQVFQAGHAPAPELRLRTAFAEYDAEARFGLSVP